MNLGELIKILESQNPDTVLSEGFHKPHSYRGYYDELAFEPTTLVSIREMLVSCKEALGTTYEGWKGGMFTMTEYTDVYLAIEGQTGDELSGRLFRYMLLDVA